MISNAATGSSSTGYPARCARLVVSWASRRRQTTPSTQFSSSIEWALTDAHREAPTTRPGLPVRYSWKGANQTSRPGNTVTGVDRWSKGPRQALDMALKKWPHIPRAAIVQGQVVASQPLPLRGGRVALIFVCTHHSHALIRIIDSD